MKLASQSYAVMMLYFLNIEELIECFDLICNLLFLLSASTLHPMPNFN